MPSAIWSFLYINMLLDIYRDPVDVSKSNLNISTSIVTGTTTPKPENFTVCYNITAKEVCFEKIEPFSTDSRPIDKSPQSPEHIDTKFKVYSRSNSSFQILNPSELHLMERDSKYLRSLSIKVIAHGYKSSGQAKWVKSMVAELLRSDEVELVIVVDWSKGAAKSYAHSVANIRVVAVQVAHLVHRLMNHLKLPISSFHMIGHSLGAHLMGYCGSYLQKVLKVTIVRITALDPAGPFFQEDDPSFRLDRSDATFIDVIHTDNTPLFGFPLTIGLEDAIGHLDFYPNGGAYQPDCSYSSFHCQHRRASYLFTESIRQSCTFIGVVCSSYDDFLKGKCWGCDQPNRCQAMGLKSTLLADIKNSSTKLFLTTNGFSPYCGSHYRITIRSSADPSSWYNGGEFVSLGIELFGARDTTGKMFLSEKSIYFDVGTVHQKVIFTKDIGNLTSVTMSFQYPLAWLAGTPTLYLHSIEIEQLYPQVKWQHCFKNQLGSTYNTYKFTSKELCR